MINSRARWLLPALLLASNVGAGVSAWRVWRQHHVAPLARAGVPPLPELHDFPAGLAQRLHLASRAALADREPADALSELAYLYHANGLVPQAVQVQLALRQLQPSHARWAYYLADLRLMQGEGATAQALLQETVRLAPSYHPAALRLADLLLRQSDYDGAEKQYRRRLQALPNDPYARMGLARIAWLRGDPAAARNLLEELVRTSPGFPTAHNLLAEMYRLNGEEMRARSEADRGSAAGRFRPADDPWLEHLAQWNYDPYRLQVIGATQMQTGRLQESLPFYERALELAPEDGMAYEALGDVYLQLGRRQDARATLERGLRAAPKAQPLYMTLAKLLRQQNRPAEAVALLQRGVALLPDSAELYNDLGVAFEAAGRASDAIAAYEQAVRLNANAVEAQRNLGLCLLDLGRTADGEAQLDRVLQARPYDANTLLALAQSALADGRLQLARAHATRLLAHHTDHPRGARLLAAVELQSGLTLARAERTRDAEAAFRAGIALDPQLPELHYNYAALLAQRAAWDDAAAAFERFVALAPAQTTGYLALGQVRLAQQRPDAARAAWARGLAIAQQHGDRDGAARFTDLLNRLPTP
ncbi:MAG TPA: tetratricopeptide repeat protein [Candidatus Synoicihabitans sp.]|nr:tetratricopeptide repeat protein [Candidatus Synoicihabitans sp.]